MVIKSLIDGFKLLKGLKSVSFIAGIIYLSVKSKLST